jgi:hypothetical protein
MVATSVFSLLLIGLSGLMLDMHRRRWRKAELDATLSPSERRYALSQYRRRTQASGIIGVLGVAIAIGPLVPHRPWPLALYLAALVGPCLAIVLLAALDAWATRQHFARLHSQHLAAQAKLAMEMRGDATCRTDNPVRTQNTQSGIDDGRTDSWSVLLGHDR